MGCCASAPKNKPLPIVGDVSPISHSKILSAFAVSSSYLSVILSTFAEHHCVVFYSGAADHVLARAPFVLSTLCSDLDDVKFKKLCEGRTIVLLNRSGSRQWIDRLATAKFPYLRILVLAEDDHHDFERLYSSWLQPLHLIPNAMEISKIQSIKENDNCRLWRLFSTPSFEPQQWSSISKSTMSTFECFWISCEELPANHEKILNDHQVTYQHFLVDMTSDITILKSCADVAKVILNRQRFFDKNENIFLYTGNNYTLSTIIAIGVVLFQKHTSFAEARTFVKRRIKNGCNASMELFMEEWGKRQTFFIDYEAISSMHYQIHNSPHRSDPSSRRDNLTINHAGNHDSNIHYNSDSAHAQPQLVTAIPEPDHVKERAEHQKTVEDILTIIIANSDTQDDASPIVVLKHLLYNVQIQPANPKIRKIRLRNQKVMKVNEKFKNNEFVRILRIAGFIYDDQEDALELPLPASLDPLRQLVVDINNKLAVK